MNEGGGAGRSDTSDAGQGGTSPATATFEVVSTAPEDGAAGVERDSSIEVTFSASVDADTVDSDTFKLIGPHGPVTGKLDTDGSSVSFTPDTALSIFTDYELHLSPPLAAVTGDELPADVKRAFRTREGVFGQPKRLATGSASNLAATASGSGFVAVSWADTQVPPSLITTFFSPTSASWSKPAPIELKSDSNYGSGCVALNEAGDAFSLVGFSAQWLWNRATDGTWATAKPSDTVPAATCALADDGTAMALWHATVGNDSNAFAASLSVQNAWSTPETLLAGATARALLRYGDGFLAVLKPTAGGTISREYDPQLGWIGAKPMIEPGINGSYWSFSALSPAALMTWNGPGTRVHASTFDGDAWTSAELGPGSGGTATSMSAAGRLAAWLHQKSAYIVRGDVDGTWHDPVKLGATNSEDYGPAAIIDASANALAAWPNGSAIEWRRSLQGSSEWSDVQRIEDQDPVVVLSTVDDAGQVTLVWQNSLGVWASRFE